MDLGGYVQIITAVGVIAALINYVITSRRSEQTQQIALETRQAQLAMTFYTHVTKTEFWETWVRVMWHYNFTTVQEWDENWGPLDHPKEAAELYSVMQMFEGAGVLLKEGTIKHEILFDYVPAIIVNSSWMKLKPFVLGCRERYNDSQFGEMFEYLFHEVNRLRPGLKNPRQLGTMQPTYLYSKNSTSDE
ncbi:MAG: hypothetical protein NWE83_06595 [Candidatus Bathyarchaeota archaeon]|nr:hypothetical protein [Candidatus Bathyarchaeota archaeon]